MPEQTQLPVFDPLRYLTQTVDAGLAAPYLAWGFAGLVLAFVGFYTLVLLYHWLRYGGSSVAILSAMVLYLGGTFIWLSAMLRSLAAVTG